MDFVRDWEAIPSFLKAEPEMSKDNIGIVGYSEANLIARIVTNESVTALQFQNPNHLGVLYYIFVIGPTLTILLGLATALFQHFFQFTAQQITSKVLRHYLSFWINKKICRHCIYAI